jgi:uncharacterized membrane protein
VDGTTHAGLVTFEALNDSRTRITVVLEWLPEGPVEKVGAAVSLDDHWVSGDLQRFKEFVEQRGEPTGAWRGEIQVDTSGAVAGPAGRSLGDGDA